METNCVTTSVLVCGKGEEGSERYIIIIIIIIIV